MKRSLGICLWLLVATSASALEIVQVRWGFDGQAVPGRFNPCSILVANPSAAPFDGVLALHKRSGLERVGAIYANPCYVSPGMTRWVQFYLYVDNPYNQWRLEWGPSARDGLDVDPPKLGPPARVLLSDADALLAAAAAFKEFPDELFPPTAAATGGLQSLLLDHAPRWEPAKRQAFVNWLRAGGTVHLLPGADGQYPTFSDELGALNTPLDRTRVGAGLVLRHPANRRAARMEDIFGPTASPPTDKPDQTPPFSQVTDSFLQALAILSVHRLNWTWIYALAFMYLLAAGPGNFLAGRRLADYRLRLLLLLVTVAGFAWLFQVVGRRGQGEASVIHTLSYARAIGGDTYEVTQWINAFATRGAEYTFTHAAPHNLYATAQDYEPVNGRIQSGRDGRFIVDIPMYSRRAFLHQAEMKGADIPLKVLDWQGADPLRRLTVSVGSEFGKQILEAWAVQGNWIYALKPAGDRLELAEAAGQPLSTLESPLDLSPFGYAGPYGRRYAGDVTDVEAHFRKFVRPLIAWHVGGTNAAAQALTAPRPADGRLELFLFARSPASFNVAGAPFGREIGYVLYQLDLFRPETPEETP